MLVHVECPVTFLYTSELIAANPMQLVGRPKLAKTLPRRRSDWVERDRALILTALLAGLRADELLRCDGVESAGTVFGEVSSFREVLAEKTVGVLVGFSLPGAMRVAEVDRQTGAGMLGHLDALVPGQQPAELFGQRRDRRGDGVAR